MARTFYKQTITIVVLSEDKPLDAFDLEDIHEACDHGDCVGQVIHETSEEISAEQCAKELVEIGSEPGFFRLDEEEEEE